MTDKNADQGREPPQKHDESYDPFRAHHPAVLVHDVDLRLFEHAWEDAETRCPLCREGTVAERGTAPLDERRWILFTCGDFIAVEHTAG